MKDSNREKRREANRRYYRTHPNKWKIYNAKRNKKVKEELLLNTVPIVPGSNQDSCSNLAVHNQQEYFPNLLTLQYKTSHLQ